MSPTAKFNSLVAGVTVFVMFWAVSFLVPLLMRTGVDYPILLSIAALVASTGVYRLLSMSVRWLMERVELVRSLVLVGSVAIPAIFGTWLSTSHKI